MVRKYKPDEKKKIVDCYLKHKKYGKVRALFKGTAKPQNRTIQKMVSDFLSGKSLQTCGGGSKVKRVLTTQKIKAIQKSVKKQPKMGGRERARKLGISGRSLRRGMKQSGIRAYHARFRLDLKAGTCAERLHCATHLLAKLKGRGNILQRLCFTDEKFFRLRGEHNLHNMVFWSDTNPDYRVVKRNSYAGVMVWCAVTWNGLIGPLFPEGKIDAELYQQMINDEFLPLLREHTTTGNTWFQQDGAPAHTAGTTVDFLNGVFRTHWIGKGSTHVWPAGSPDLTVPDYWLWNRLLQDINSDSPKTKAELKTSIITACQGVTVEECQQAILGFQRRLEECIEKEGDEVRSK
jgi:hypothetical protein